VQHLAQHLGLDEPSHRVEQRVVPLHEVGNQDRSRLRAAAINSSAWPRHGQRLLDDHVLARLERGHRLRVVKERRRGDVNDVHVALRRSSPTSSTFSTPNRAAAASDAGRCVPGHADEPDPRHLGEVLQREQAEPTAADHPQSNVVVVHECRPF